ncbi:VQ motif-containing protein 8, chloroplastic-like [Salvia miltiorrhiza]|uniref:VQ motif-containing protein 8, chloroplastic-like n=1 Tax=Salvia miltiorrhiza TaxID=226208 RepID=UPI0025AD0821|nr:VQ motif-containing protein 8, chloroplastic-like [Salvia miltiorrhiza]
MKKGMSPLKFQDSDATKGVINGPRPPPLRVNKDSHVIHKPHPNQAAAAKRQPVIIYTHSPKVIHAQPHDFMILVQRLTGMSRDDEDDTSVKSDSDQKEVNNSAIADESSETTSSVVTDDESVMGDVKQDSGMYKMSNNFLLEAPLFTPASNDFFCSQRPNSMFQSPAAISPSFMDYIKAFPDY